MQAFRTGERPATVMDRIAKGFTDEEIARHRRLARRSAMRSADARAVEPSLGGIAAAGVAARRLAPRRALGAGAGRAVVVIGGGFAGATCARALTRATGARRDAGRAERRPTPPARSATP